MTQIQDPQAREAIRALVIRLTGPIQSGYPLSIDEANKIDAILNAPTPPPPDADWQKRCVWTKKPDGRYDLLSPSGDFNLCTWDTPPKWYSEANARRWGRYLGTDETMVMQALATIGPPPDASPQPKVTRIEPRCPRCHQLYDACGCDLEASTTPQPKVKAADFAAGPVNVTNGIPCEDFQRHMRDGTNPPQPKGETESPADTTVRIRTIAQIIRAVDRTYGIHLSIGSRENDVTVCMVKDGVELSPQPWTPDSNSPPPTDDKPQVLRWGCKIEQQAAGLGVLFSWSVLSPTGAWHWIGGPGTINRWCHRSSTQPCYRDKPEALAALNACATPPPDWKEPEPKASPWPKDLTTLVGKRITTRPRYGCDDLCDSFIGPVRVMEMVGDDSFIVEDAGRAKRVLTHNMRDLLSIEDPSPPAETEWLPVGMDSPVVRAENYVDVGTQGVVVRELHRNNSQWRPHCERITAERDEANQRHARVVEENGRLSGAILWALGCNGHFPVRRGDQGAYWWRRELRNRANMTGNIDEQLENMQAPIA